MIWKSIRSTTLQRRSREFYWKCIHNTFRVGSFWSHVEHLERNGTCQVCDAIESLEHIALECNSPEQKLIWALSEQLWLKKYDTWPTLNWGLILGCNVVKFRSPRGRDKGTTRLFRIVVSESAHLIWRLRNERVIQEKDAASEQEIHNHWRKTINNRLHLDCVLTNNGKYGKRALKKALVKSTWKKVLKDEDALPKEWYRETRVLVGVG
ncbi:hypothetical protein B0H10DRAFT_2371884 [Mycena sp. CBHHK59/15]|nr:hypothetical protein B0H10DRAFT_2371884 [Mycena sp. CBHHK59/15]